MKYFIIFLLYTFASCSSERRINKATARNVFEDSTARISLLDDTPDRELAFFETPDGKKILLKKYNGPQENPGRDLQPVREDTIRIMETVELMSVASSLNAGAGDLFTGSVRAFPKTNYSSKKYEKFKTIPALFRKLPSPQTMKDLGIGHKNERVTEEDRNVRIEKAYLYTITVEPDKDLHLLIGNTPVYKAGVTRVFNAEISGVPPDGTTEEKNQMKNLRAKAIAAMGDIPLCGRTGFLQAHRRISIRGSLFFDSHHASKPAKCREVEGESAWEIHPVKDIIFD
jgi:hypothetical protein